VAISKKPPAACNNPRRSITIVQEPESVIYYRQKIRELFRAYFWGFSAAMQPIAVKRAETNNALRSASSAESETTAESS
jgi:hypothetical protein